MSSREPTRTAHRRPRSTTAAVVLVAGAALIGALGYQALGPSSPSVAAPSAPSAPSSTASASAAAPAPPPPAAAASGSRSGGRDPDGRSDERGALGAADGVVADGVTIFDDDVPAVTNLDPALLAALRRAASAAGRGTVTFVVTSGWRSPAYQAQLLQEAISTYGSEAEAARWVATPTTSAHVSGDAVDLATGDATDWLSQHGASYGLCQIYRNEPWHFERRPDAAARGCPAMYADPTHDPRMHR